VQRDAFRDPFAGFDVRILHIDRADAKLSVPQQPFVVRGHVVLDQETVAIDPCDDIRLISASVEVAVAYLAVIVGPDRIISLAYMHQDVNIIGNVPHRVVDRLNRRAYFRVVGNSEVGFIDLNMLAPRRDQAGEILMQQFPQIVHHAGEIVVVFVKGHGREPVWAGHPDFDGFAGEGRARSEFIDQSKVCRILDLAPAHGRRMKDVRVMFADGARPIGGMKGRHLVPEMVEHRVGRGVPVMRAAMHLAPGNDINAGGFLFENGRLHRAKLCVREIGARELTHRHEPIQSLVPPGHAVSSHDRGRIGRVLRHAMSFTIVTGI
jgi:hypothetical protein